MKSKMFSALLAICLLSFPASRALAQPASPGALLRQAYTTLSFANQDYQGHRYAAMQEIEAAAKILKFDIRGDGTGGERQRVSDEQLRAAKSQLEQARGELRGRAGKHVDRAIKQINTALKIR
jgi:hypothetical protein